MHRIVSQRVTVALAAIGLALAPAACKSKAKDATTGVQTAAVSRQDIVVDVEATGVIAPINGVDVRSKASGQIIAMPVTTGSQVKKGDLLVKIDPRTSQNQYNQAVAALKAARATAQVDSIQLARQKALAEQGVITAPELESAQLAYANAQAQVAAAETNVSNAEIALEDVTIRAPIAGTVIAKNVSVGQVISSAVNSASGGTVLLTMADLSTVVDSTLVSESDIGNVRSGLQASVHVDAYPNRTFRGAVDKIEPQATVQQSVTMFPVLIRLENADRALMPGMNSDVQILVEQKDNVLAVPNDAVRSPRDASAAATALGLDPNTVRQQLVAQRGGRAGAGGANGSAADGARGNGSSSGAAASAGTSRATTGELTAGPVSVSQAQCDSVQSAFAKHPDVQQKLQTLRQQMRSGSGDQEQIRQQMRTALSGLGVDARVVRACLQLRRGSAGGTALAMGESEETPDIGNTRPHPGLVFVAQNGTFVPKIAMLGVGNYDVTQVLSGLQEGDHVALISAALLQQARQERQQQIQSRVGLPGVRQQPNSTRAGSSGTRGGRGGNRGGP